MSHNASGHHGSDSHLILESTQLNIGFTCRTFMNQIDKTLSFYLGYVIDSSRVKCDV